MSAVLRVEPPEALSPDPPSGGSFIYGGVMLSTLALICVVIGVILIVLGAIGVTSGVTPYGTHGGVTLVVIGIILYVVVILLSHGTVA